MAYKRRAKNPAPQSFAVTRSAVLDTARLLSFARLAVAMWRRTLLCHTSHHGVQLYDPLPFPYRYRGVPNLSPPGLAFGTLGEGMCLARLGLRFGTPGGRFLLSRGQLERQTAPYLGCGRRRSSRQGRASLVTDSLNPIRYLLIQRSRSVFVWGGA